MIIAKKILNTHLPALHPSGDVAEALRLMDQFRVSDLPVVDGGKFLGMVSENALITSQRILQTDAPLAEFIAFVKPDEHILEVLKVAGAHHLSVIPVVESDGNYVGAITLEDLVGQLSQLQGAGRPGGIIVLEMPEKDYSLQQIARIVEENDAKILSTSLEESETGFIEVNLKINQPDLNPILQSLGRFGYHVKASYQEQEYTEALNKRYEELMRFLNI